MTKLLNLLRRENVQSWEVQFSTTPLIESFRGIRNKPINKKETILLYKELKGTENWKETENIKEIVKFVEEKAKKNQGERNKIFIRNNEKCSYRS